MAIPLSVRAAKKNIVLPAVEASAGMDVIQAIEIRTGSRRYDGKKIPTKDIATILWAGYGVIYKKGDQTIHGFDAVTGATPQNRYSIPVAWGKHYLKVYLLLKKGAYEYLPKKHKLKLTTNKNLMKICGSSASNPSGVIVITADFDKIRDKNKRMAKDVALVSAGSAAQNMVVAGSALNVQMLIQMSIKKKPLIKGLKLNNNMEPLLLLSFGHSK